MHAAAFKKPLSIKLRRSTARVCWKRKRWRKCQCSNLKRPLKKTVNQHQRFVMGYNPAGGSHFKVSKAEIVMYLLIKKRK